MNPTRQTVPASPAIIAEAEMDVLSAAREAIEAQATALQAIAEELDGSFVQAVDLVLGCAGRVVVTGLGKSGLVGSKIAATLASTGTPAHFVHAADALHGDAGMLTRGDVLLALSNSGETMEACAFARMATERGVPVIALTGRRDSTLASSATVVLLARVQREADPLDLAPTTSTTAALVIGDAIAIALMQRRGFTADDFARNHPGGALGEVLVDGETRP